MRLGLILTLMLTVGCVTDADGDGVNEKEDCDDNNSQAAPSFSEICDGIDNDCDGEVDEGVTDTYYIDADADGFGLETITTEACELPSGYVENAEDCDDTNSNSYPGADELCDEEDNDCDDDVDEGATTVYYADSDGDGFGADRYTSDDCSVPDGYAVIGGDCDDTDAAVNPDAEEICDGIDNDCKGDEDTDDDQATDATVWYLDEDNDGFGQEDATINSCDQPTNHAAVSGDCDDADPLINPDALEICDALGVDEDCDSYANDDDVDIFGQDVLSPDEDSGASVWFGDADGDGFGGDSFSLVACEAPQNYVSEDGDCNDLDDMIHPDADEICDDVDNDCDEMFDDADNDVLFLDADGEAVLWYIDVDSDGFGSDAYTLEQCIQPSGYVRSSSEDLDCNDGDDEINPGMEEICNDDKDNNCDSSPTPCALEDEIPASDADFVIMGEDFEDKAASALALGDFNNDGYDDLLIGAVGLSGEGSDEGGAMVFYGPFDDANQTATSDADAVFYGTEDGDQAGFAVTSLDLDGDNYDDIVITSTGTRVSEDGSGDGGGDTGSSDTGSSDTGSSDTGSGDTGSGDTGDTETVDVVGTVYVIYGSATKFSGDLDISDESDLTLLGTLDGENFGCALANAGDLNGDDREELVLGNCIENDNGKAFLLYGSEERYTGSYNVEDELENDTLGYAAWEGDSGNSLTGHSVAGAHDFNGDGLDDFVFGAYNHDVSVTSTLTYTNGGAAFLVYGDGTDHYGSYEIDAVNAYFNGENASDNAGYAVSGLGDINGDGYADVAVGAPGYDRDSSRQNAGISYILFGSSFALGELSTTTRVLGGTNYDLLGKGLANAGDLDTDGYADVVVAAPDADGNTGAAYLMYGPISGEVEVSDNHAKFAGSDSGAGEFGLTFANPGDLNGDGVLDLVVGAPSDDDDGESENTDVGAVYIFTGGGL